MTELRQEPEEAQERLRTKAIRGAYFILLFYLAAAAFAFWSIDLRTDRPTHLTLEETVGLALNGRFPHNLDAEYGKYLDPSAKKVLMDAFDRLDPRWYRGVFCAIGELGDSKQDVDFIESRLLNMVGRMSVAEAGSMELAFLYLNSEGAMNAIARMAHDGAPEASERLRRMAQPQYWKDKNLFWESYIADLPYDGAFRAAGILSALYPDESTVIEQTLEAHFECAGIALTPELTKRIRGAVKHYVSLWRPGGRPATDIICDEEQKKYLRRIYAEFVRGDFAKGKKPRH